MSPVYGWNDVKDVDPSNYEPLPVGDYVAQVTGLKKGTSKSGNKKTDVEFTVVEGTQSGRKFWDTLTYKDTCLWKIKMFLKALNFAEVGMIQFDTDNGYVQYSNGQKIAAEDIKGKTVLCSLEIDANTGNKPRNNVTSIKPITAAEGAPQAPAQQEAFPAGQPAPEYGF